MSLLPMDLLLVVNKFNFLVNKSKSRDHWSLVYHKMITQNLNELCSKYNIRLFTRKIPGMLNVPYPDRPSILRIKTSEARRLTNDLFLCFKIIHGFIKGSPENFGLKLSQRQSRGHNFKLEILHSLVNVRKHFLDPEFASHGIIYGMRPLMLPL